MAFLCFRARVRASAGFQNVCAGGYPSCTREQAQGGLCAILGLEPLHRRRLPFEHIAVTSKESLVNKSSGLIDDFFVRGSVASQATPWHPEVGRAAIELSSSVNMETNHQVSLEFARRTTPIFVLASDAMYEAGRASGGFLLFCPATILQSVLSLWIFEPIRFGDGGNLTARCESAMLPIAIIRLARILQHNRVVWFLDNKVALHCVVKLSATDPWLHPSIAVVHFLASHFNVEILFEFR